MLNVYYEQISLHESLVEGILQGANVNQPLTTCYLPAYLGKASLIGYHSFSRC